MKQLINVWQRFFFQPGSPRTLGVCRFCFYATLLGIELENRPGSWAELGNSFWMPMPLFRLLGCQPPGLDLLIGLSWVWRALLLLACVGLFTRLVTPLAFVLGVYLLGLPNNLGVVKHTETMAVFVLAILAVSRCGDALSLDQWLRGRFTRRPRVNREDLGEYTWPLRLVWVLMVLVYFAAGMAKLRNSSWRWIFSDNMQNILIQHHYTHVPEIKLGLALANWPWICWLAAGFSMMAELLAPLALAIRRLRLPIIGSLFLMQIGIWLLLGVQFPLYLPCYLFWVPWDRCVAWVSRTGNGIFTENWLEEPYVN